MKKLLQFQILISVFLLLQYSCKDPVVINHDNEPQTNDSIGDVYAWLTTGNEVHLLSKLSPINFSKEIGDFTIVLDTASTFQYIDGFGAALTGSSAYLINQLNSADRTKLLTDLFDPQKGIGLNKSVKIGRAHV